MLALGRSIHRGPYPGCSVQPPAQEALKPYMVMPTYEFLRRRSGKPIPPHSHPSRATCWTGDFLFKGGAR